MPPSPEIALSHRTMQQLLQFEHSGVSGPSSQTDTAHCALEGITGDSHHQHTSLHKQHQRPGKQIAAHPMNPSTSHLWVKHLSHRHSFAVHVATTNDDFACVQMTSCGTQLFNLMVCEMHSSLEHCAFISDEHEVFSICACARRVAFGTVRHIPMISSPVSVSEHKHFIRIVNDDNFVFFGCFSILNIAKFFQSNHFVDSRTCDHQILTTTKRRPLCKNHLQDSVLKTTTLFCNF